MSSFMCVDCSVSSAHPDFGTLDDYNDHRVKCHGATAKKPKAALSPAAEVEPEAEPEPEPLESKHGIHSRGRSGK